MIVPPVVAGHLHHLAGGEAAGQARGEGRGAEEGEVRGGSRWQVAGARRQPGQAKGRWSILIFFTYFSTSRVARSFTSLFGPGIVAQQHACALCCRRRLSRAACWTAGCHQSVRGLTLTDGCTYSSAAHRPCIVASHLIFVAASHHPTSEAPACSAPRRESKCPLGPWAPQDLPRSFGLLNPKWSGRCLGRLCGWC